MLCVALLTNTQNTSELSPELSSSFNMKSQLTINEIFYHSMLTGTKHVANDSFIFQPNSALVHHAYNTVQLLESETHNFTHFDYVPPSTAWRCTQLIIRSRELYITMNICWASTRLKKSSSDWLKSCNVEHSIAGKRCVFHVSCFAR